MTIGCSARPDDCSSVRGATDAYWRRLGLAALSLAMLLAAGATAQAQPSLKRVALVIGNAAYANAPQLANPRNDARAMAASLRSLGFIVEEGIDLDTAGMYGAIRTFGGLAETADVALVFYAGHGIQVDGTNYLLPTDVSLSRERDLNYEGVALELIMSEVAQTRRLGVVILDACRDNPFAQELARSMGPTRSTLVGRGLARVEEAPADTLIAFATRDGAVADDGTGINSPYTTALLSHLAEPGLEIGQYFRKVRDSVVDSTNGRQEPFVYGSLSADQFYLNPPATGALQQAAITPPTVPSQSVTTPQEDRGMSNDTERLFWESVRGSSNKADFEAYLRQFPDGVFAALARNRIAVIVGTEQTVAPPASISAPPDRTETALALPPQPALSARERREVQRALRRLGLYGGAIDGLIGPGSRAAIVAFQRSIGATADGNLTDAQQDQLRQDAAAVTTLAAQTAASEAPAAVVEATVPATPTPIVEQTAPKPDAPTEIAVLPPPAPVGNFGAIATGRGPNPVRRGVCKNQPTQDEADACALSKCGVSCDVHAQFGSGQCAAFVESREWSGGEGYGVGEDWGDAVEAAKIECFRVAGRNYTCELIASACNE